MTKKDFEDLADAYEFGSTYPVVAVPPTQTGATPGTSAPSQLQQVVTQAIQGVLGRSFKQGDFRSFRAALEVSFEYKETAGRSGYEWKPRAYPSVGATDIGGGISGAQYSLVSFSSGLHEKAAPLIDNLHSLVPDVDEENFAAAKSIFITAWDEFVGELAREGGVRPPRANALAQSIFNASDGGDATGHLVRLGALLGVIDAVEVSGDFVAQVSSSGRFEFTRGSVVTSEEEGHLTSFIALTDYYFAVANSWQFYFDTFFREKKDLGGRLLDIERQLAVIEDGVNEVFVAMDSVNVDQAERLILIVTFDEENSMSVEDFLSWIASFASQEAPQLIREGGKWGIQAVVPMARVLHILAEQLISKCETIKTMRGKESESGLPSQFGHSRVLNPLYELTRYLKALRDTAESGF